MDHLQALQADEDPENFPAEQLQHAFLARLKPHLPAQTRIKNIALGEFAWILTPELNSEKICSAIRSAFNLPFDYGQYSAIVSLSIAVVDISTIKNISSAILELDHALQNAQAQGGNKYYQARADRDLLSQIPSAIERKEFSIYFQSIWSNSNKQLVGAEALLRWHGLELNNIDPAQLVRMVEAGGKISSLGNWIIQKSCTHASNWLETWASPLTLNLNISSQQLCSANFLPYLTECLEKTWVDPRMVGLEFRYADFLAMLEENTHTLISLNKLGLRLVLDNIDAEFFSSDYQTLRDSLTGLSTFTLETDISLGIKVHSVKFSPELIIDVFSSENILRDHPMLKNLEQFVLACKKESILTVAVGVENEAMLKAVTELGIDFSQGYLLGKPLSSSDFDRFTRSIMYKPQG